MLDLSPTKLLIIFVVVIVLLGPKRLPQVARQLGAAWRKVVGLQRQIEQELREKVPDLPSSHEIARFARSPTMILNHFAQMSDGTEDTLVEDRGAPTLGRDANISEEPAPEGSETSTTGAAAPDGSTAVSGPSANAAHGDGHWPEDPGSEGVPAPQGEAEGANGPRRPDAPSRLPVPKAARGTGLCESDLSGLAALADDPTMN